MNYLQYIWQARDSDPQIHMSGGAAAGDFDGDGWVDLAVTRANGPAFTLILYRNMGDGTFEDVTAEAFAGVALSPSAFRSNGVAWGDIDNDADLDLYVTTLDYGRHLLFINDGSGSFTEEAESRGAAVIDENGFDSYGFSATYGDYDRDGYLDIHVTEWRLETQVGALGHKPDIAHNTRLLRNLGAVNPGFFEDVTVAAGVSTNLVESFFPAAMSSEGFASRFSDIDRDGYPDLLIASDHKTSRLFWNNGDGTFLDGTEAAGVGDDRFGMGSAVGDVDGDGDLDWFVTSIWEDGADQSNAPDRLDGNRLYRYDGDRSFSDITIAAGVRDGGWGWGAAFLDYDNDGDLDLTMTNGVNATNFGPETGDRNNNDQSILWENDGRAVFANVSDAVGIRDRRNGKGLLTFDYDKDGDVDIFVVNNAEFPVLYRNNGGNDANWLRLDLTGTLCNRQAIGAFLTVVADRSKPEEIMVREVDAGSHFLGQSELTQHFGLGAATAVDELIVDWPDGSRTRHYGLTANTVHQVVQPTELVFNIPLEDREIDHLKLFEFQMETNLPAIGFEASGLPSGLSVDSSGLISGTPNEWGDFAVTVTVEHADGNLVESFDLRIMTTYSDWANSIFAEEGEGDEAVSGAGVDFDLDGRNNFQEYAEQTNPKAFDSNRGVKFVVVESEGIRYAGIEYQYFVYGIDLDSEVVISSNLSDWAGTQQEIVGVSKVETDDGFYKVVARAKVAMADSDARFLQAVTKAK